ncbi:pentapeptide repeat-containing protein [Pelagibius sp.]|uniref:pentapeptide repeat-containing protein n=1 Tax=Pelagibius sp. TaxID=1931238 RepID=UPI00261F9529|nr:pentapeptide repeat-containing protein [Pelagibius sp.]
MNREESIALFNQGREVWNAWAHRKFAQRKALMDRGQWFADDAGGSTVASQTWWDESTADFSDQVFEEDADFASFVFPGSTSFHGATFGGTAEFGQVRFEDEVDFQGVTFEDQARFGLAVFKGYAGFGQATFKRGAWFQKAKFGGAALFEHALFVSRAGFHEAVFERNSAFAAVNFEGDAEFVQATFSELAAFQEATFEGQAKFSQAAFTRGVRFRRVNFNGPAWFRQCGFFGATDYSQSRFLRSADFNAIETTTAFSLAGATFQVVPDFVQAHFSEALRCDDISIATKSFRPRTWAEAKDGFKGNPDLPARWRALKRLAIQGHDHEHEQIFFKGELLARRWHADKPWSAAFWFGVLYQWLSDFGRSLLRPLVWWGVSLVLFAGVYLSQHDFLKTHDASTTVVSMAAVFPSVEPPQDLLCRSSKDNAVTAAFDLSIRNALLFVGQTSREKLRQNYVCLYGSERIETSSSSASGQASNAAPRIPNFVVLMGHLQNVISAVLIFLFLLGIRNHFKIK